MSGTQSNPLISGGTINRVRGNLVVNSYQNLNVTASYLGEGGMEVSREGAATTFINNMTSRTPSPEPYMPCNIVMHLVKAQTLAQQWENQLLTLSYLGGLTFYPDVTTLGPFVFRDAAIMTVMPIVVNGKSGEYGVTLSATYEINGSLWSLSI